MQGLVEVNELPPIEEKKVATVRAVAGRPLAVSGVADAGDAETAPAVGALKSNVVFVLHVRSTVGT